MNELSLCFVVDASIGLTPSELRLHPTLSLLLLLLLLVENAFVWLCIAPRRLHRVSLEAFPINPITFRSPRAWTKKNVYLLYQAIATQRTRHAPNVAYSLVVVAAERLMRCATSFIWNIILFYVFCDFIFFFLPILCFVFIFEYPRHTELQFNIGFLENASIGCAALPCDRLLYPSQSLVYRRTKQSDRRNNKF